MVSLDWQLLPVTLFFKPVHVFPRLAPDRFHAFSRLASVARFPAFDIMHFRALLALFAPEFLHVHGLEFLQKTDYNVASLFYPLFYATFSDKTEILIILGI